MLNCESVTKYAGCQELSDVRAHS